MTKYRHTKPPFESQPVKPEKSPACPVSGKRMYTSEREAKSTAAHRMADRESGPAHLGIYKCPYCSTWHLTSKEKTGRG